MNTVYTTKKQHYLLLSNRASKIVFIGNVTDAVRPAVMARAVHLAFGVIDKFPSFRCTIKVLADLYFDFIKFDSGASAIAFGWAAALRHLYAGRANGRPDRDNDWS